MKKAKKNATKSTKAPAKSKAKRPPRTIWIVFDKGTGEASSAFNTKAEADAWGDDAFPVAGPYVLAERLRNE